MNLDDFRESVEAGVMPPGLSLPLRALWMEASGDWHRAHEAVQSSSGQDSAWVHAYLHRKEGDISNAAYWYGRASRTHTKQSLQAEWASISTMLLRKEQRQRSD